MKLKSEIANDLEQHKPKCHSGANFENHCSRGKLYQ